MNTEENKQTITAADVLAFCLEHAKQIHEKVGGEYATISVMVHSHAGATPSWSVHGLSACEMGSDLEDTKARLLVKLRPENRPSLAAAKRDEAKRLLKAAEELDPTPKTVAEVAQRILDEAEAPKPEAAPAS